MAENFTTKEVKPMTLDDFLDNEKDFRIMKLEDVMSWRVRTGASTGAPSIFNEFFNSRALGSVSVKEQFIDPKKNLIKQAIFANGSVSLKLDVRDKDRKVVEKDHQYTRTGKELIKDVNTLMLSKTIGPNGFSGNTPGGDIYESLAEAAGNIFEEMMTGTSTTDRSRLKASLLAEVLQNTQYRKRIAEAPKGVEREAIKNLAIRITLIKKLVGVTESSEEFDPASLTTTANNISTALVGFTDGTRTSVYSMGKIVEADDPSLKTFTQAYQWRY